MIEHNWDLDDLLLLGPGPSTADPDVLKALSMPVVGHLDPAFIKLMDEVQEKLRRLFKTKNKFTIPISGTGTAGMETCLINLIEPDESVLVGVNGYFGERLVEIATRCQAKVRTHNADWGSPLTGFAERIRDLKPKIVAFVHAETSTGVLQPPEEICKAAHEVGAYVIMDCVTSLGGCDVRIDEWGVDAAYSGTQKCIGAPPGLSPVTFSDRAVDKILTRKNRVQSFYLDISLLSKYWDSNRAYHHTAPISMIYALDKALDIIESDGLEHRFNHHMWIHEGLMVGLEALNLTLASEPSARLPVLNPINVPEGIDEAQVRQALLTDHGIEVGSGLGSFKGKVWRVGLMGYSSSSSSVFRVLLALGTQLHKQGFVSDPESGCRTSSKFFAKTMKEFYEHARTVRNAR